MADHTFSAAIEIADSRIAAGQPITEDLMHDLRDRDQEAADVGLEDRQLYIGGKYYNGGWNPVFNSSAAIGPGAASQDLVSEIYFIPPPGVTSVKIRPRCSSTQNGGNYAIRMYLDGVQVAEWTNFGAIAWRTFATGIAVTPGTNHEFKVEAKTYTGAGSGSTFTCTAVQIICE